jgi:hypothetical protein
MRRVYAAEYHLAFKDPEIIGREIEAIKLSETATQ